MKTLYEILNMTRKNSVMRSVVITDCKSFEGVRIVEVEAFDDTFLNATKSVSKYDDTIDRILKCLAKNFDESLLVIIDTDNFGHIEILLDDYYKKEVL